MKGFVKIILLQNQPCRISAFYRQNKGLRCLCCLSSSAFVIKSHWTVLLVESQTLKLLEAFFNTHTQWFKIFTLNFDVFRTCHCCYCILNSFISILFFRSNSSLMLRQRFSGICVHQSCFNLQSIL